MRPGSLHLKSNCLSGSHSRLSPFRRGSLFQNLTFLASRSLSGNLTQTNTSWKHQPPREVCLNCWFPPDTYRLAVQKAAVLTRFASILISRLKTVSIELCRSITKIFYVTGKCG
jgi:hypothetical protein